VATAPKLEKAKLAGDAAPKDYLRFEVAPFRIPASWANSFSSVSMADFAALNAPGAGLMALKLRSVGPSSSDGVWSFGSRDCRAVPGTVTCDGTEQPSVALDGIEGYAVAASWRRALSPKPSCNSERVFWDLASRSGSGLPTCDQPPSESGVVRFEIPTPATVPQVLVPDENPGEIDPRGLSLVKFELVSGLKFRMRLQRPNPRKAESADNPIREVTFHVQFP